MTKKLSYYLIAVIGFVVIVLRTVTYHHSPFRYALGMTSSDDMRLVIMNVIEVVLLIAIVIIVALVSRKQKG